MHAYHLKPSIYHAAGKQERVYNGYRIAQHRKILIASEIIVGIPPFIRAHPSMCLVSYDFYYDFLIIIIIYS
jgi:hypothetical protein